MTFYAGPRNTEIMSFEEYAQLSVRAPYILNIHARKGHLLYFGAEHTYDPTHPQLSELEKLWQDFHPTIAFYEGRGQAEEKSRKEAVACHGEAGIVWFLAARNRIPVQSLEPYRADEVAALLQHFSGERIKLFYILRQVTQHRRMRKVEPLDDYTNKILFKFSKIPGLEGAPCSLTELEETFSYIFPELHNWKEVPESLFNPTKLETFTNDIARRSSLYRDQHMVKLLTREVRQGKRVFAVVGFSHVVMQERALLATLL